MIYIKNPQEIQIMREGGSISAKALAAVLENVDVGVRTLDLDKIAEEVILDNGGEPSFKTVENYSFTTCINVNDGLVHGIPGSYKLKVGDLVSVDLGTLYKGFHTDLSYTMEVGTDNEKDFLNLGKEALESAISKCKSGNRIGDISYEMQRIVQNEGYTVSRDLVGHGIGKELHESPYVPCYGRKNSGPKIKEGMVFAVEVIYQKGNPDIKVLEDGWTIATEDGTLAGLFEQTVAVTAKGPEILTKVS